MHVRESEEGKHDGPIRLGVGWAPPSSGVAVREVFMMSLEGGCWI
jgi:hypothetical protein